MPKYNFKIDGKDFNSKKAVIKHVQEEIHSKYADHVDLTESHLRFMVGLLNYHPWGDQKIGVGVRRMWVQPNGIYPTRGFWLERIDGTKTDFSFYQCVQPASPLRDFKGACRTAVAHLMIAFRHNHFQKNSIEGKIECPISGKMVFSHETHVDHSPPNTFDAIVMDFITDKGIDVNTAPMADHSDGNVGSFFTDESLETEWIEFHNNRAVLRVISEEENLRLGGKTSTTVHDNQGV